MTIKKVFVGGIKDNVEEPELKEYFSSFGSIESVEVITDKETGKKRGFAFVTFNDYDPVDKVVCKCSWLFTGFNLTIRQRLLWPFAIG